MGEVTLYYFFGGEGGVRVYEVFSKFFVAECVGLNLFFLEGGGGVTSFLFFGFFLGGWEWGM